MKNQLTNMFMTAIVGIFVTTSIAGAGPGVAGSGDTFSGPGTLSTGPQGCPVFAADSGESFFVDYAIETPPDERVYIVGTIDLESDICFPLVGPALLESQVWPLFEECGELVVGPQGCLMITTDAGPVAVENTNGFFVGDVVCVVGAFVEESDLCYPTIGPGVLMNTIHRYFEGCGVLARGPQTCVIFHADSGEGFAVRNLGDFFIGDYVYVTGSINEESLMCWPASAAALENNTIEACEDEMFGDLNGDHVVNIEDIFAVLGLWGTCADDCPPSCRGDLTGDCQVNIDDVFAVLGAWR